MLKIVGRWQDMCRRHRGEWFKGNHGKIDWDYNQIQNTFAELIASWARAESGYDRIGFMGNGSGLVGWDSSPPAQPYSQTTLTTEYSRLTVSQANIIFIDPDTDVSTGGTPSSKLEITVNIGSADANGDMREFGLFGGTATSSLDSGEIVNWIVHSKIEKDTSLEIQRKVRIEFQTL